MDCLDHTSSLQRVQRRCVQGAGRPCLTCVDRRTQRGELGRGAQRCLSVQDAGRLHTESGQLAVRYRRQHRFAENRVSKRVRTRADQLDDGEVVQVAQHRVLIHLDQLSDLGWPCR